MLPLKFLEIRCSEIASKVGAVAELYNYSSQNIASTFWLFICAHAKPVDIKFPQENSRTAGVVTDGEIVDRRASSLY